MRRCSECGLVDPRGGADVQKILVANRGEIAVREMNTSIQVKRPVTEMTTCIDIVRESMRVALGACVIEGIKTNIPLHLGVLNHSEFLAGNTHTRFLEELAESSGARA